MGWRVMRDPSARRMERKNRSVSRQVRKDFEHYPNNTAIGVRDKFTEVFLKCDMTIVSR
jgi:hypothetical protein